MSGATRSDPPRLLGTRAVIRHPPPVANSLKGQPSNVDSSRLLSIAERWAARKFISWGMSWGECAFPYLPLVASAKEENQDPISLLYGKDLAMLLLLLD